MSVTTAAIDTTVVTRSRLREVIARVTECRTAKVFARRTGVSPATVRSWRQGTRSPGAAELIAAMAACEEIEAEVAAMIRERKALLGR